MRTLALALIAIVATSAAAAAAPVSFSPMPADGDVPAVVKPFIGDHDVSKVETAVLDLNGDKTSEILIRLDDACDAADAKSCRMLALRFANGSWKQVLDATGQAIELGSRGFAGMSDLTIDGTTWAFGSTGYHVDFANSGTPVKFQLAAADYTELLAQQFGAGALTLFKAQTRITIDVASVSLSKDGAQEVVVRMKGPGACGVVYGCPWRVLRVKDGAYETLLEGTGGAGTISVLSQTRDGWNDIAAELPNGGVVTYGWDGSRYGVAQMVKGSKS